MSTKQDSPKLHPNNSYKTYMDRSKWNSEDCDNFYENYADDYDKGLEGWDYRAPELVTECVQKYLGHQLNSKILDIGAGTGLAGVSLQKHGFTHIYGLEPSKAMLKLAEEKNVYSRIYAERLTEENTPNIESDEYDCAVMAGSLGGGHIPCMALKEVIRIIKPGGYFVNVFSTHNLTDVPEYKDRFVPFMEELVEEGYWQEVERTEDPLYARNLIGLICVHRITTDGEIKGFKSKVL